jgi:hypothetical protein
MTDLLSYFRSHWRELLIAGVWLQSVVSAAFSRSWVVFALTAFGGLLVLLAIFSVVGWVRSRRRPTYGDSESFDTPRQALVFTVGRQKDTILFSLQAQRPAWLGLLCTRQTEGLAREVAEVSGLDTEHVQVEIVDPWSVVEVRDKTIILLDWLARRGVPPGNIAVDITGGTSVMTAGTFSVASERQIDTQYVRSDYDENNRPVPGSQRGVFVVHFEEADRGA